MPDGTMENSMMRPQRFRTALGMAMAAAVVAALVAGHDARASNTRPGQGIAADADKPPAPDTPAAPGELAREGLAKLLQALDKLIESVPQYQMPEINENGDIILRRKRPYGPTPPAPSPDQPDKRAI